jgi:hypothetical protein
MLPTIMGRWFSLGPPVSSTNKTERHDITEILLKVALNNIKPTNQPNLQSLDFLTMLKHIFRMIIQFCKLLPVQIFTVGDGPWIVSECRLLFKMMTAS